MSDKAVHPCRRSWLRVESGYGPCGVWQSALARTLRLSEPIIIAERHPHDKSAYGTNIVTSPLTVARALSMQLLRESHLPVETFTYAQESTHSPGFNTPPRAVSPTSSQGSWVFDPEDGGWDGLGASPAQVGQIGQQERLVQREASSAESLLHSWAGVPRSPPVAEYPTNSPPCSPISTRSRGSSGAAGEGLVGLAREEISDQMETLEGHAVYFSRPPSTMEPRDHVAWASGVAISSAGEFTEVEDVDMVDDAISNSTQEPVAIVTGMTKAETIEAIAEAAEIETATLPRPVSPQLPAGPLPPLRWASPLEEEATMVDSRPDEVPGTASPLRVHPSPSSTIDVAADAGPTVSTNLFAFENRRDQVTRSRRAKYPLSRVQPADKIVRLYPKCVRRYIMIVWLPLLMRLDRHL